MFISCFYSTTQFIVFRLFLDYTIPRDKLKNNFRFCDRLSERSSQSTKSKRKNKHESTINNDSPKICRSSFAEYVIVKYF